MQIPIQISFDGQPISEQVESACRKEAAKLEKYARNIIACRVVISTPQHRHVQGTLHEVRIEVSLPQEKILVTHVPPDHARNEDLARALRDAFDTARRKIQDAVRKRRGSVKLHETPAHGVVARLFPSEEYGFITAPDGREIYFHARSVLGTSLGELQIGEQVRFVEEQGEKGPQATSLARVGTHHHLAP